MGLPILVLLKIAGDSPLHCETSSSDYPPVTTLGEDALTAPFRISRQHSALRS